MSKVVYSLGNRVSCEDAPNITGWLMFINEHEDYLTADEVNLTNFLPLNESSLNLLKMLYPQVEVDIDYLSAAWTISQNTEWTWEIDSCFFISKDFNIY